MGGVGAERPSRCAPVRLWADSIVYCLVRRGAAPCAVTTRWG